jgi:hypothetical protein
MAYTQTRSATVPNEALLLPHRHVITRFGLISPAWWICAEIGLPMGVQTQESCKCIVAVM